MGSMRRLLVIAAALGFVTGGLMIDAPVASASPIDGVGQWSNCPIVGQLTFKPALLNVANNGNSPELVRIKAKSARGGTCSIADGDFVNVVRATFSGGGSLPTNACSDVVGAQTNSLLVTAKWRTAPRTQRLNPSVFTVSSEMGGVAGNGHQTIDAAGAVNSGSDTGGSVAIHIETDQTAADISSSCAGPLGLKRLTFGMRPGSDDVTGSATFLIGIGG
jgi:hypothetical protein